TMGAWWTAQGDCARQAALACRCGRRGDRMTRREVQNETSPPNFSASDRGNAARPVYRGLKLSIVTPLRARLSQNSLASLNPQAWRSICGWRLENAHAHSCSRLGLTGVPLPLLSRLALGKIAELERPRRHPKALGTTSNLLSGSPSSIPCSRSDTCRANEVPSTVGCSAAEQSGRSLCPGTSAKALLRST